MSLSTHIIYWFTSVKWLGKDTLTPLAVDGKGGKAELLEKVGRWVVARGRNVTQPGTRRRLAYFLELTATSISDDCFVRNSPDAYRSLGKL